MKLQAMIPFLLLRTRAVLSHKSVVPREGDVGVALPECALPCKTVPGLGAVEMKECLKANCGVKIPYARGDDFDAEEGDAHGSQGNDNSCVARCRRLRFSPHGQEQCIADCNEDDGSRKSTDLGTDEEDNDAIGSRGNDNSCVARCKRLRFSPHMQEQCIADCDEDDASRKSTDLGTDEEESDAIGSRGNDNSCVARCRRLRFSPHRQEQCIADCDEDDASRRSTDLGLDEEENDAIGSRGNDNSCVSRCKRLRFSPHRQEQCIADCNEDDDLPKSTDLGTDEEENDAIGSRGSNNSCVARCRRLRFSPHRQEQCIADCGEDDASRKSTDSGTDEEKNDAIGSRGNDNSCVSRCKRLRFSPHRQEQCIEDCDQDIRTRDDSEGYDVYAAAA